MPRVCFMSAGLSMTVKAIEVSSDVVPDSLTL